MLLALVRLMLHLCKYASSGIGPAPSLLYDRESRHARGSLRVRRAWPRLRGVPASEMSGGAVARDPSLAAVQAFRLLCLNLGHVLPRPHGERSKLLYPFVKEALVGFEVLEPRRTVFRADARRGPTSD